MHHVGNATWVGVLHRVREISGSFTVPESGHLGLLSTVATANSVIFNQSLIITFRVRRSQGEMCIGHGHLLS